MFEMERCSICLKITTTVSVQDSDKDNVKWCVKLQDIIPELEWLEEYVICEYCAKQLHSAWEFKKTVLSLERDRKNGMPNNELYVEGNVKDNSYIDYLYDNKKDIYCEICLKTFTTETQLHQHKLQIHERWPEKEQILHDVFTCYNCNATFNFKEELIPHIENECKEPKLSLNNLQPHQVNKESYNIDHMLDDESNISTQPFDTKDLLESPFEVYKNQEESVKLINSLQKICKEEYDRDLCPYFCEKCSISFPSIQKFNSHNFCKHNVQDDEVPPPMKKRRGRKPQRKFNCEVCNEEFAYVKLVIEHCVSVHTMDVKIVKPYSCEQCNMRFGSSANLDQHRNYHTKNRTHICSLCGKGFITKSDLTVHEYTHFNRRNYKCSMCDKAFNTNKNLRTHNLVVHTNRNLWKYVCSICEKRFPLKTNYDQHLRRHTGEKQYICHICKKSFISKSELQRHVHMHSNIRAFKCSNCDKEYKERRTYLAHLAKKHGIGDVKVSVREKKFVCHICPSQFYDKQKLMRHICSHSGLKPFPCYMCDKKFTDKSYLKHHLKVAHKIVDQSKTEDVQ